MSSADPTQACTIRASEPVFGEKPILSRRNYALTRVSTRPATWPTTARKVRPGRFERPARLVASSVPGGRPP